MLSSSQFFNPFPESVTPNEGLITVGDKVVNRGTRSGSWWGEAMGIAPAGKQFTIRENHIAR